VFQIKDADLVAICEFHGYNGWNHHHLVQQSLRWKTEVHHMNVRQGPKTPDTPIQQFIGSFKVKKLWFIKFLMCYHLVHLKLTVIYMLTFSECLLKVVTNLKKRFLLCQWGEEHFANTSVYHSEKERHFWGPVAMNTKLRTILTHWGRGHLNCLNACSRGF